MNGPQGLSPTPGGRNLSMEGLRGFLAFAVVLFHIWEMGGRINLYSKPADGGFLSLLGVYIVCIFFCISGYLIVQSLIVKGNLLHFFRNRAVRIYPVFLVLNIIIFVLGPKLHYEWMGQLLGNTKLWLLRFLESSLFLPGVFNIPVGQKNAWSLSYEMVFYLAAASFYFVLRRWRNSHGPLLLVAVGLIAWHADFIFFAVGYSAYLLEKRGVLQTEVDWLDFYTCTHPRSMDLSLQSFSSRSANDACVLRSGRANGAFAGILKNPVLVYLGKISYSLYLVHPFALDRYVA